MNGPVPHEYLQSRGSPNVSPISGATMLAKSPRIPTSSKAVTGSVALTVISPNFSNVANLVSPILIIERGKLVVYRVNVSITSSAVTVRPPTRTLASFSGSRANSTPSRILKITVPSSGISQFSAIQPVFRSILLIEPCAQSTWPVPAGPSVQSPIINSWWVSFMVVASVKNPCDSSKRRGSN